MRIIRWISDNPATTTLIAFGASVVLALLTLALIYQPVLLIIPGLFALAAIGVALSIKAEIEYWNRKNK